MAMMCRTRLMRRFPARDRRWRRWSPDDASRGAVPFPEAKWPRLAKRRMSPMSRAAPGRPDAVELQQAATAVLDQGGQFLLRRFDFLVDLDKLADEFGGQPATDPSDEVTWADGDQQGAGLVGRQEGLRAAGQQFQQEFVDAVDQIGACPSEGVAAIDQKP